MHALLVLALGLLFSAQTPSPSLKIVVLEGEDAVNVVQQKTAVRPLVEVRDRNNVPVAGATVTFTIGGGQPAAFAGGVHTLTVTTNAAGQAAASGFNVVGSGAVQIQVQAAYQGQIATAAIAQTNVATAAAASQAGAAQAAGGGAAGGGGGISATTIAIVGGAVAGGAVVATQVAGGGDGGGDEFDPYQGTFSGQLLFTNVRGASTCTVTRAVSGTLKIDLRTDLSGGAVGLQATAELIASTGCTDTQSIGASVADTQASGGPSALAFTSSRTSTSPLTENTNKFTFTGSHSGNTITGSLTMEMSVRYIDAFPGTGSGSVTMPVTLTRTAGK